MGVLIMPTDLAAIRYRFNKPPNGDDASRIIYVTDHGQANHFAGVFQVAKKQNGSQKIVKLTMSLLG